MIMYLIMKEKELLVAKNNNNVNFFLMV